MKSLQRNAALLCALFLGLCVLGSWPVAETGMHDDWSYARTAQVLAQTGHIVYNGWGAPTLGVQLFPAALLIKLLGFSFTIARLTNVGVALVTTVLLQRSMVRSGLNDWNASIATLTLMLSPVCLPVVTGFLSDMWCLFAIVIAFYGCLRAVTASTDAGSIKWICFAALGNTLIGSSRQIGWLGLLVMVPSALWLLRRRRSVLKAGIAMYALGCAAIALMMHWFSKQPYTLREYFHPRGFRHTLRYPEVALRPGLGFLLLLLPIMLMFLPRIRQSTRLGRGIAGTAALITLLSMLFLLHRHTLHTWIAPFNLQFGDLFSATGVYVSWPVWGYRQPLLPAWVWAVVGLATLLAFIAWLAFTFGSRSDVQVREPSSIPATISWRTLLILLVPFAGGYLFFLMPRALQNLTIDRIFCLLSWWRSSWLRGSIRTA